MKGNEINTKLNGLYQQMSKSKGVMIWTIIFTPFFLRVSLGVSWAFILVMMIEGLVFLKQNTPKPISSASLKTDLDAIWVCVLIVNAKNRTPSG